MKKLLELVLKLYPREFRESFREEIREFIENERTRADHLGSPGPIWWLETAFDLLLGAVRLRLRGTALPAAEPGGAAGGLGRALEDLRRDAALGLRSIACYGPARRATSFDPIRVLRAD